MASDQTTDKILDLLYGELSADEEPAARASVAQDPTKAEEFAAFEELRAQIQEHLTPVVASASVREALLAEAARSATRRNEAGPISRRAAGAAAPNRGLWARISKGTGPQIALVAAVLLASAYVLKLERAPSMAPEIYEPQAELSVSTDVPPVVEEDREAEGTLAAAENDIPVAEPAEAPRDDRDSRALARGRAEKTQAQSRAVEPARRRADLKKKSLVPRPTSQSQRGASGLGDMLLEDDAFDAKGAGSAMKTAAPRKARQVAPDAESAPTMPQFAEKAAKDDSADKAELQSQDRAPIGSLDAVEDAYAAGDWRQVVQTSDAVLEGNATAVQKARALELKAQAYQRLGMLQQALSIYRRIESNYSGYQPDRIRAARTEMERQLDVKSSKTRSKSSNESESEAVPAAGE